MQINNTRFGLRDGVREKILEYVSHEKLSNGCKLPSEKNFAKTFGVSHLTVRAAMKSLINDRTIEKRPRSGTYLVSNSDILKHNDLALVAVAMRTEGHFWGELSENIFGELRDNSCLGQKASSLNQKYAPNALEDLKEAFDALKSHPDCSGKIGSVGFCFGGRMSLALGINRPVDAICTFYGGGMQQLFDQLRGLKAPVLGLYGDKDQSVPVGTIEEFDKLLDQIGVQHEVVVYPNSGHAFFRDNDPNTYRPEAAKDAWERATKFLAKNLN